MTDGPNNGHCVRSAHTAGPAILLERGPLLSGSVSERSMYGGLQQSRVESYQLWRRARESERAFPTRLKGSLSLEHAHRLAFTHNKLALQERHVSRRKVLETYSNVPPGVTVTAGHTSLDEVPGFDVGEQPVAIADVDDCSAGLEVKEPRSCS